MNVLTPKLLTTLIACTALLSGCFNVEPETVNVSGKVTKGPMAGATVSLYNVDNAGAANGAAVASTTTDANGDWTVSVPAGSGLLLVQASGGSYVDESDPEPDTAKKRTIQLSAGDMLEGILPAGGSTTSVTAVTSALVAQARRESSSSNIFSASLATIQTRAAAAYGFDPLIVQPANPLAPAAGSTLEQKDYGLLLGGLAYAMNDAAVALTKSMMDYSVIDAMVKDLSDCSLDGKLAGTVLNLDVAGVSKPFPAGIDLSAAIRRFLNNNFQAYAGHTLPTINLGALCQAGPVAGADGAGVNQGGSINIAVLANDSDPDSPSYDPNNPSAGLSVINLLTDGLIGSAVLNPDNTVTYTATVDFIGTEIFFYTVVDAMNAETIGMVTVDVYGYVVDWDGDGYLDAHEVMAGSDPRDWTSVPAGTDVTDTALTGNTVWGLAGAPYRVQNPLALGGFSLTIDPGTIVQFAAGAGLTVNSSDFLNINGGSDIGKHVIFTSVNDNSGVYGEINNTGVAGDWLGVTLASGSGSSGISYLKIRYADVGLKVVDSNVSGVTITGLSVSNTTSEGVWVEAVAGTSSPLFQDLVINTSTAAAGVHVTAALTQTAAPVFSGSNEILGIDIGRSSILVDGAGTATPSISGFRTNDGNHALELMGNAGGTYSDNVFNGANSSGVRLNTTGVVTLSKNLILNNGNNAITGGGVEILVAGTGTKINHNLIRGNVASDGGGIYMGTGIPAGNVVNVGNNLILQNVASLTGGGVSIAWVPSLVDNNWYSYNTITENTVNAANKGGGVFVSASALIGLGGNIISGNLSAGVDDDVTDASGTGASSAYNLTNDGSLGDVTDITELTSTTFVQNWYLSSGSSAVNGDGSVSGFTGTVLQEFLSLTTQVDGTVDGSGADTLPDLGYHHFAAAPAAADTGMSSLNYTFLNLAASTSYSYVILTPKDAGGNVLGAGLDVDVTSGGFLTIDSVKDLGDGRYQVYFTTGATGPDQLDFTVNGVALPTKYVTVNW